MYLRGDKPVYIRSDDRSTPARATDLQALLDKVKNAEKNSHDAAAQARDIARDFYVSKASDPAATFAEKQDTRNRRRSNTFFRMDAVPERAILAGLDSVLEHRFVSTIYSSFPSIAARLSRGPRSIVIEREDRASSWYRYHYLDVERDHEAVWAFNRDGVIQFTCQSAGRIGNGTANLWSLVDFFINLDGALRLAHEMWAMLGYFGNGQFLVNLQVPKLFPHMTQTYYPSLFYDINFGLNLDDAKQLIGAYELAGGTGEAVLSYDARTSRRVSSLANLGNQVLRDLRFGVDLARLIEALGHMPPP